MPLQAASYRPFNPLRIARPPTRRIGGWSLLWHTRVEGQSPHSSLGSDMSRVRQAFSGAGHPDRSVARRLKVVAPSALHPPHFASRTRKLRRGLGGCMK